MGESVTVGIDLGGTTLSGVVVDRNGGVRAKRTVPADVERGPVAVIAGMTELVDALLADASAPRSALVAVGVGSPGPLSHRTGRIMRSPNLPGWVDVPLRDDLRKALNVPVMLDNDGNTAAFGEHWTGAGRDGRDLVMFTLGTGVGAGVIIGGRILHGHFENAAELGHTIVVKDGLPCSCGQCGCLEQYASARSVARRVVTAINAGEASELSSAVESGESIDAEAIVKCAQAGDSVCLRIWDEACQYLAVACINIQHAYNPSRVVLGGGLSEAGGFLLDNVKEHVARRQWSLHDDLPTIVLAELGRDAGAIGAGGLAWEEFDRSH